MSAIHIADTGFLVALGTPSNDRSRRVRTVAERNDIEFVVPERVYEEMTAGEFTEGLDGLHAHTYPASPPAPPGP